MSLTGESDGPPTLTGTYIADHLAGLYGAIGTLLALHARDRTGEGQLVDVASLDALFSCLGTRPLEVATLGPPRRDGIAPLLRPANVFEASDGYLYIHGGTNALFMRLCTAIGRPDLAAIRDSRRPGRIAAVDELEDAVSTWTTGRTVVEASDALAAARHPIRASRPGCRRGRLSPRSRRARCLSRSSIRAFGFPCGDRAAGETQRHPRRGPQGATDGRRGQRPGVSRGARPAGRRSPSSEHPARSDLRFAPFERYWLGGWMKPSRTWFRP